ncbi:FUSC family protein [Herbiconiux sp. UC225_62]|uniref:FUSC family protein n=1 Tax=Herbiconiux sp. UC225_62 TaxID=3350168 RepID=UPI0036D3A81B
MAGASGFRSLLHLDGAGWRWPVALRAGLAVALPIAVFALLGHTASGLQASVGAFTAIYVANAPVVERMRVLPVVGFALVLCAAGGAAAAVSDVLTAAGLLLVAAAASILCYGFRLGPPGPVFFPLVFGAAAHITAPVDGARLVDPVTFVALFAGGCALAYLLAISPIVLPRARRAPAKTLRQRFAGPSFAEPVRTLILRSVSVAVLGAAASFVVDTERAYWIVCAGLAIVAGGSGRQLTLTRGLHRVVGTLAGAFLYLAVAGLSPAGLWLAVVLGVLQFAVEIFVVRNYALALLFITPLVLIITGSAAGPNANPVGYAAERVLDTVVGAALAVLVTLLWHEHRRPES